MMSIGVFSALTSASHAIGSFSSCDELPRQLGKAVGIGCELPYSAGSGVLVSISGVIDGIIAVNAGCHPFASYATEPATSLFTLAGMPNGELQTGGGAHRVPEHVGLRRAPPHP